MMWLEALLSALLVALAFTLLIHAPLAQSDPLSDTARYWSLSDRAAALAELGSDAGPSPLAGQTLDDDTLRAEVFSDAQAFCYRWQWLQPAPRGSSPSRSPSLSQPTAAFYSDPICEPEFESPPAAQLSLERGVWRQGQLQFLRMDQTVRPK